MPPNVQRRKLPENLPQPTPEELSEGTQAIGEAAAMAAGIDLSDREKLNNFNDLLRSDSHETHMHRITVCATYLGFGLSAFMLIILVSCYTIPSRFRPLDKDEILSLQGFLFSGVLGGFLGKFGPPALRNSRKAIPVRRPKPPS